MDLKQKLLTLPTNPGCYLMKDAFDHVIYVGKAKNLKNRVKSYFTGAHNEKTTRLVQDIVDFSYVITNSEQESLILELNLIKQYNPKYNIKLMDDKTYPYIHITDEKHPKLELVRTKTKRGKNYFGPFPNAYSARETVTMLNRIYPFRKCQGNILKPCMYYHIHNCYACSKEHQNFSYQPMIHEVQQFLKGDTKSVLKNLEQKMKEASEQMAYEKAIEYRNMMKHIELTTEKQLIDLNNRQDVDILGFAYNENDVSVHILKMREGKIIDRYQSISSYTMHSIETIETLFMQYYQDHDFIRIWIPKELAGLNVYHMKHTQFFIPQKGDKKKLVQLAMENAQYDLDHYHQIYRSKEENEKQAISVLEQLVKSPVHRIDIFDNSQLFGVAPISAMVVYEALQFNKSEYRKYHLTQSNQDDYQAIREVIYRRYYKCLMENIELPSLILVDGGKGHVHAAIESLHQLGLDIKVMGIKKNAKHQLESLYYQSDIALNKQSILYKWLLKLSEEVHRFAISFHRKTRTKHDYRSLFDDIKGLGVKRKQLLLKAYPSLDLLKDASEQDLNDIGIPIGVAKQILEVLK